MRRLSDEEPGSSGSPDLERGQGTKACRRSGGRPGQPAERPARPARQGQGWIARSPCAEVLDIVSLFQIGGSRVRNLGHPAHPRPKGTGDHNMPEKRGQGKSANRTPRKTRVVGSRLNGLKSSSGRDTGSPIARLTQRDVITCRGLWACPWRTRVMRHRTMSSGVGTNGRPVPRSDVRCQENSGSPTGREPQGDGTPIVVGERESRLHGEGG